MTRGAWALAPLALVALTAGCGPARPAAAPPTGGPWQASVDAGHPLVGRIWEPATASFTSSEDLITRAGAASYVVLGEKHDHADHHRLQARVLKGVLRARRTPVLALEMIDVDEQERLDHAPAEPGAFAAAVGWDERGFAPFSSYRPVLEVALGAELRIVGANLPRAQARAVAKGGLSALDAPTRARLGLDAPQAPGEAQAMAEEIRVAHCDVLPPSALPSMAAAQRARDATLAATLAAVPPAQGAVLITGAGHARRDRGVPAHLARRAPGAVVVSIAFVEVEHDKDDPAAYGALPYDAVWFTPRLDDLDPCRAFRKRGAPSP
ncbi:MAG: ChaN family lipoprotein [Polyangiaceae bacterium]|nr:ChaN family lipoprotein [Polyangiaceae bacterium]